MVVRLFLFGNGCPIVVPLHSRSAIKLPDNNKVRDDV